MNERDRTEKRQRTETLSLQCRQCSDSGGPYLFNDTEVDFSLSQRDSYTQVVNKPGNCATFA